FRRLPDSLKTRTGAILPGVHELLNRLRLRDDCSMGLLTGNFSEGARLKLSHYGLYHHFRFGGDGDDHLDRDDVARAAYLAVQGHHPDVHPRHVWVIGDTPADIRCGRAIGARVLAVATGMYEANELRQHEPDILLNDLRQPDEWLRTFGAMSAG